MNTEHEIRKLPKNPVEAGNIDRYVAEWKAKLVILTSGLLIFETLTGLAIYFLPFNLSNQMMVLIHTLIGLIFIIPYIWYQIRHYVISRQYAFTYIKFLGQATFTTITVCSLSGLVLTYQGAFSTRISYTMDLIHIISTFVLIAAVATHILFIVIRNRKLRGTERGTRISGAEGRFGWGISLATLVFFLITFLVTYAYSPVIYSNAFPEDYSFQYGEDRPFAPSLAKTTSGGAYDPRSLAESEGCGTSLCHEEIVKEWLPSAHRYASMDAGFQVVQKVMADQNGPVSTRYCGGCHDPIALFSGSKNIYAEDLSSYGADEGVSCIVCHTITETDVKGNASYTIVQPKRYAFELKEGKTAKFLSDFLIRSYPRQHIESYKRDLYKTAEYCGACHKQFIDEEINNVGWVQLQNQYDNWRKSHWNNEEEPEKTLICRDCHMRLVDNSSDPASGDPQDLNRSSSDKKHRHHAFIASNQFMPAVLNLPGHEEHIRLTEEWLRGETVLPEIADRWVEGPAIPIKITAPEEIKPGEEVRIKVNMTNNKVGHDFPTGPLDIIQCWVELVATNETGDTLFSSGMMDTKHFIEEATFIFKAEGIDQYGNLIDRHNLWEMVGARFKRALFPGFSDVAEYRFMCPSTIRPPGEPLPSEKEFAFKVPKGAQGAIDVKARLRYRKVGQFLMNFLFGEESGLTTKITDLSEDTVTIPVKGS
jgi:hypothetical protein